jgi:hypothetical protein
MAKRKKAIHAVRKKTAITYTRVAQVAPETVEVANGKRHSHISLLGILKKAELDIRFLPHVDLHTVGNLMFMYDGREVYVGESDSDSKLYHGILNADVMKEITYSIKPSEQASPSKHYFSKVRRLIVMR